MNQQQDAHHFFVTLIGESIGVALLAVLADMSDDAGKVIVAIMAGTFLLFLMINAQFLHDLIGKANG